MPHYLEYSVSVMTPQELPADPQRDYKVNLRQWLKAQKLNIDWLAVNLGKSPGTVKNWLYNTMPITEENQDKIELLQKKIDSGDIKDISFESTLKNTNSIGYVHLFSSYKDEKTCIEERIWKSLHGKDEESSRFRSLNHEWKLAAEADGEEFAAWITDNVMNAVRKTLKKEKAKIESGNLSFSLSNYPHAYGGDASTGPHSNNSLPVILDNWKTIFLQIASHIEGFECCDDYIILHLNAAAQRSLDNMLNDFLCD